MSNASRLDGLRISIAVWLGTMDLAELQRMDATLTTILRARHRARSPRSGRAIVRTVRIRHTKP